MLFFSKLRKSLFCPVDTIALADGTHNFTNPKLKQTNAL